MLNISESISDLDLEVGIKLTSTRVIFTDNHRYECIQRLKKNLMIFQTSVLKILPNHVQLLSKSTNETDRKEKSNRK